MYMNTSASRSSTGRAMLAALTGNSIFGFSFMFSRIALESTSPFVMLMYRFVFAFALVSGIAFWAARRRKEGWLRFALKGGDIGKLLLLGLVHPVVYFLCESYGISMTNATVSGVIIALVPIVALGAGALFLKEKPTWQQICFSLLSIGGVIVMTLRQSAEGTVLPLGILLLFFAVLSGVSFNLLSRHLSEKHSALERTYIMMAVGCAAFTLLALFECRSEPALLLRPLAEPSFVLSVLYLSAISSILAFLCINYAASILSVSRITAFCNVTTLLSVFAGVIFLGDPIDLASVIAACVIIIGVFGVQKT